MSIDTFSPPPLPLPPILSYTKKQFFYGFHSKDTHIEGLWRPKDGSKSGSGLRIEDTKSGQIEGFEPSTSTLIIFESILRPIEVSMSTKKVFLG